MQSEDLTVSADGLWGESRLAYHVQARLSEEARQALSHTQEALQSVVPLALHLIPKAALHVSIYALVPVRLPDAGKEQHWQQIADRARADLTALCAETASLRLNFHEVRVTPSAIIAVARDPSGFIATVRDHFASTAAYRFGPAQSFDLIHCTLARFQQDGCLSRERISAIARLALELTCDFRQLSIVRERVYPCLTVEEVTSVALSGANSSEA